MREIVTDRSAAGQYKNKMVKATTTKKLTFTFQSHPNHEDNDDWSHAQEERSS